MVEGIVVASAMPSAATWFEQRSCGGKIRLTSRGEARGAARYLVRPSSGTVRPYCCRFCDGWHVGHPMKSGRSPMSDDFVLIDLSDGALDGHLDEA
jgi:hypothetical protein